MHILGDLSVDQFLKDYWQKKPLLIRDAFTNFQPLVTAQELAGLSLEEEIESRVVIEEQSGSNSIWSLKKGPFNNNDYNDMPSKKWSLLVQAVDHWLPEAADLLEHFRFIPSWRIDDLMISYASDGGSVGPHYDQYDVFLLQAEGRREWQIGQSCNSLSPLIPDSELNILQQFHREESWTLEPGDMLYLPPKVAHWGIANGECQTYSIGFRSPNIAQLLDRMLDETLPNLNEFDRYEDTRLELQDSCSEISIKSVTSIKNLLAAQLDNDEAIANMVGHLMTEAKYPEFSPQLNYDEVSRNNYNWNDLVEVITNAERDSQLTRHEHARFCYFIKEGKSASETTAKIFFFYQGERATLQAEDIELVKLLGDQRHYQAKQLISAAKSESGKTLLTTLWLSELVYSQSTEC